MLLFGKKPSESENVVIGQSSFKCLGLSHRSVRSAKGAHYANCKKILIMIRKILKPSTRLDNPFKLAKEFRLTHEQKNVSGTTLVKKRHVQRGGKRFQGDSSVK